MDDNVHKITKTEHHWLPTCPCEACRLERHRRKNSPNTSDSRIKTISLNAAEILFGIPRRSSGSLASEMSEAADSSNSERESNE